MFTSISCASTHPVKQDTPFLDSYVFTPDDGKPHPGIFMVHGSAGGAVSDMWVQAMYLVSHGFTVMTFCWFDCGRDALFEPAKPLAEIELQKTIAAMKWFKESPHVNGKKIGLFGISRGAEHALILASYQDRIPFKIDAVAVHAPSDVVVGGFSNNWIDKRCWICKRASPCEEKPENWNPSCGDINLGHKDPYKIPAWLWSGKALEIGQRIEIEKYAGPVFITAGNDDAVWESDRTRRIEKTLTSAGRRPEVHVFPNEGHALKTAAEQKRKELSASFFTRGLR
ncbi:MAG: acyl-CoA thioester hydrolase/BAAT C-terminal domain-containing protein [Bdellovibrionota bacterium]